MSSSCPVATARSVRSYQRAGGSMLLALAVAGGAHASEIGQIKVSRGQVSVERSGQAMPGVVGLRLQAADRLRTGDDGSVGITMNDDSLLSAGPNSVLSLDQFALDSNASQGRFATTLGRGTLAVALDAQLAGQARAGGPHSHGGNLEEVYLKLTGRRLED